MAYYITAYNDSANHTLPTVNTALYAKGLM